MSRDMAGKSPKVEIESVQMHCFRELVNGTSRTQLKMQSTMIARLDSMRTHKRERFSSGRPIESFFKGRVLHVNPGFAAFIVGLDGAFHPVPPGRTVLDAHGEKSNRLLSWLRDRTEEGVTLYYYRSVEIPMSLTWPVLPELQGRLRRISRLREIEGLIKEKKKALADKELRKGDEKGLQEDLEKLENEELGIKIYNVEEPDWAEEYSLFKAGQGIRSRDDFSGIVIADLQLRVKDPLLFFQTVIAGSEKYRQWVETCQGEEREGQKQEINVYDLYDTTVGEVTQAIQNAIRQQTAQNLVEDRDARDHVHGEVAEHIRRTFENYGLDLSRIPTLTFRSPEYEGLLKSRVATRLDKEITSVEREKGEIDLQQRAFGKELERREFEIEQDEEMKKRLKESRVQSERRALEEQQYKEGMLSGIEREKAHQRYKDVVEEDTRRRASEEAAFQRAEQTVQKEHHRKEETLDKEHQRAQTRAEHELQIEQERAQIQLKAEKARIALELYKQQKEASTDRFLQILAQIKELPIEIQEMILARELGPEAVKVLQARTNMQLIDQQRQLDQRHTEELKAAMAANTQLLHQLATKGIEAYAYVQGKKFDSQKQGLVGGDVKVKKIEMEAPDEGTK